MSDFMRRALELAGRGRPSPNPMVGCVIVKGNKIISEGYHKKAGMPHAEAVALKRAGKMVEGATMYVTLEPCSHFGRTPPCTKAIISAGIRRVVIAMRDPNPLVNGKGIRELRKTGIRVELGVMKKEAERLNEFYIKHAKKKIPFVILKTAMTLDGRIATESGESKWITCTESRKRVHELRNDVDAILVGINTVIKDNPRLTCRIKNGKDPLRVIVDSKLRTPKNARVLGDKNVLIATTKRFDRGKKIFLDNSGFGVLVVRDKKGKVDLKALMKELGGLGITSVMIEGGSGINTSAIRAGVVDKVMFFIAPKILGKGVEAFGDLGLNSLDRAMSLKSVNVERPGSDILVEGYL